MVSIILLPTVTTSTFPCPFDSMGCLFPSCTVINDSLSLQKWALQLDIIRVHLKSSIHLYRIVLGLSWFDHFGPVIKKPDTKSPLKCWIFNGITSSSLSNCNQHGSCSFFLAFTILRLSVWLTAPHYMSCLATLVSLATAGVLAFIIVTLHWSRSAIPGNLFDFSTFLAYPDIIDHHFVCMSFLCLLQMSS